MLYQSLLPIQGNSAIPVIATYRGIVLYPSLLPIQGNSAIPVIATYTGVYVAATNQEMARDKLQIGDQILQVDGHKIGMII